MNNPEFIDGFLHYSSLFLEVLGVSAIVIGAIISTTLFLRTWQKDGQFSDAFSSYRLNIARGILLGLEFLVAADIIGTVLVDPTLKTVGVLAVIVLIRTCLSYSLEIEIHGRLPWQQNNKKTGK